MDIREKQKAEAVKRLKMLVTLPQPIREFEEEGKINLSENGGLLYWLNDEEKGIVDAYEKSQGIVVYHVIKSMTNIGKLYSLLFVSRYEEEWSEDDDLLRNGECYAYVVNASYPDCTDLGSIGVAPKNGGVVRTF